jgi:hypothetical protein
MPVKMNEQIYCRTDEVCQMADIDKTNLLR